MSALMKLSSSSVTSLASPISLASSRIARFHRRFASVPVSPSLSFLFSQTEAFRRFPSLASKAAGRGRRKRRQVSAVFERFTERAIKAVVFSQREAKSLGSDMVFTQHLLLGLIAEDCSGGKNGGYLGSGITVDQARLAVRAIWNDRISGAGGNSDSDASSDGRAAQVPFSISTKRVLEAAVEYSRSRGYNFIAPEHIALGLFSVDDGSAARVLQRYIGAYFIAQI